jgi:uncharacterized repeat protein (TIGR01451 family)
MTRSMKLPSVRLVAVLLFVSGFVLTGAHVSGAQTGADVAAGISAKKNVKLGGNITYTVTATNVGDSTATGVLIDGWVPDWFNFVSSNCGTGTSNGALECGYGDVAPGASVSMTITVEACCPEPHMFELGFVSATNDSNADNDTAQIKVVFTGGHP